MSDDELYRVLGRIEGTVNEIKSSVQRHDDRIRSIEGFKSQVLALAGFLAAGISVMWELIKTIVSKI